jgi:hypothetical protein
MKLKDFHRQDGYVFILAFANGEIYTADLQDLIGRYVNLMELPTAQLNAEWGCLEFKTGTVDIEPKTLYKYANRADREMTDHRAHLESMQKPVAM